MITDERVTDIHRDKKTITTVKENEHNYDYLVLAMGSAPFVPPIWAFHGADDQVVKAFTESGSVQMVKMINETSPLPRVKAKVTVYAGIGHNSWTMTYNGAGMGSGMSNYDKYDMNIYDWMLQYRKE